MGRNVARDTARHNEVEDLPHKTPLRYSGNHSVGHAKEYRQLKGRTNEAETATLV